jgi:hypothetical protein
MQVIVSEEWRQAFPRAYAGTLLMARLADPSTHPTLERRLDEMAADLRQGFAVGPRQPGRHASRPGLPAPLWQANESGAAQAIADMDPIRMTRENALGDLWVSRTSTVSRPRRRS